MRIWTDCSGGVITTELTLVTSMIVAGITAGLANLGTAVQSELNDLASAVQTVNQSYAYTGVTSPDARTAGSGFVDYRDSEVSASPVCLIVAD